MGKGKGMNIIKNGTLVTPSGLLQADLAWENGKIVRVGETVCGADDTVYDAGGCFVFPGFIDEHTHLQMNTGSAWTADDFESGTRAAVCGGTTTIVDFATQDKGDTLMHALETWKKNAEGVSRCNYAFHMAICDWNERTRAEMPLMRSEGVCSFKVYMAYDNLMVTDAQLLEILQSIREIGGICGCHCENGPLIVSLQEKEIRSGHTGTEAHPVSRPPEAEAEAVNRFAYLARLADCPVYIVHLSSALGLEEVRAARRRGQEIYTETCPQYLLLDDSVYAKPDFEGAKYVCSPPLRRHEDMAALKKALLNGEIDAVATDHCSFRFNTQKIAGREDFRKIPNGLPGIEHRPAAMFALLQDEDGYDMQLMNTLLSEGPAKLMGMYPRKGALVEGADADITVWDPSVRWTITAAGQHQNVDYTPFEGIKVPGRARLVFVGGVLAARDGEPTEQIAGTYVCR